MEELERRVIELEAQIGQLRVQEGGRSGVLRQLTDGRETTLHYHPFGPGVPPEPPGSMPIPRLITVGPGAMYPTLTAACAAIGLAASAATPYVVWVIGNTTEPTAAHLYLRPYITIIGNPGVVLDFGNKTLFLSHTGTYDLANVKIINSDASYPPLSGAQVDGIPDVLLYHVRTVNSSGPGFQVDSPGTVVVTWDCHFKGGSTGVWEGAGTPSLTMYATICEATTPTTGIGMRLRYVVGTDAPVATTVGCRFIGAVPVKIETACTWQHYGSQFDRTTSSITGTETLLPGSVPAHVHTGDTVGEQLDHGAAMVAASLLDDDHPQYLLVDGTRAMTGNLDLDGHYLLISAAGTTTIGPNEAAIDFEIAGAVDFTMAANEFEIISGSHILVGAGAYIDLDGAADALVLDADGDTTISAPADDRIDFEIAGNDILQLVPTALKSQGSLFPNLGTTTLAEKIGHIYLGTSRDVYPFDDGGGLFQRNPDSWNTPTTHFNEWSGWVWATYAGFVTPANIDIATYPSVAMIWNSSDNGVARAFAYRAAFATALRARCSITGIHQRTGLRMDDASNNNYAELWLDPDGTGLVRLWYRYAVGGAVTGPTQLWAAHGQPHQFYILLLANVGDTVYMFNTVDTPQFCYLGNMAIAGWTPTRSGIYHELTAAAYDVSRASLFDWFIG